MEWLLDMIIQNFEILFLILFGIVLHIPQLSLSDETIKIVMWISLDFALDL